MRKGYGRKKNCQWKNVLIDFVSIKYSLQVTSSG